MSYHAAVGCILIAIAIFCSGCTSDGSNTRYINKGQTETVKVSCV